MTPCCTRVSDIWRDSLFLPAYFGAASLLALTLSSVIQAIQKRKVAQKSDGVAPADARKASGKDVSQASLNFIRLLNASSLASCFALAAVSITSVFQIRKTTASISWAEISQSLLYVCFHIFISSIVALLMSFVKIYMSILSAAVLLSRDSIQHHLRRHATFLSILAFAVFAIRDLWPIALYDREPVDGQLGWLLWTRIGLVGYIGLVVPIVLPGVYVPVDPNVSPIYMQPQFSETEFGAA